MSPHQQREGTLSAPEHAEQILTRAGAQLGQWAGRVILRVQQTAQTLRDEAGQMDTPASESAEARPAAQTVQPSLERAEMVVDHFAQRVSLWALGGNSSMKRTMARLREDVEDMWVEAREIQKEWQDKYGHADENDR